MSNPERISSLHDDIETPFEDRNLPEYRVDDDGMHREEDTGKNGERSVIQRIHQFGVSKDDLRSLGIENPMEMTQEQYGELLSQSIEKQYDTLFASVFTHWEHLPDAQDQMSFIKKVSAMYKEWGLYMVRRGQEMSEDKANIMLSLEGADVIHDLGDVQELYDADVRLVTLQYNTDNAIATTHGLTPLGIQSVKKMFELGVSVDLSHVHPNVRENVLDLAQDLDAGQLVSYSHGATVEDIKRDAVFHTFADNRGLSQKDLQRILSMGGIVGLGVTRPFFQNVEHMAERIDKTLQLEYGAKRIALGTDFGGVPDSFAVGIHSVEDVARLGDALSERFQIPDATIKDIMRNNVHEWAKGLGRS